MALPKMLRLLAEPMLLIQKEPEVWVAECCGNSMVAVKQPLTCNTCKKSLDAKVVRLEDLKQP